MECPNCKRINPDSAARCDCGYNFDATAVEDSSRAPSAAQSSVPPSYKLFDAWSVALAAALGAPFGGGAVMALNYRRLGNRANAVWALLLSALVTVLAGIAGKFLSQTITFGITVGLVFAMLFAARSYQGAAVSQHLMHGGRLSSRWAAVGLGALCGTVMILAFASHALLSNPRVMIGSRDNVFYSGSATATDATAIGNRLKDLGYFNDKGLSAEVFKDSKGEAIAFTVQDGAWNRPDVVSGYENIALRLVDLAGGSPLRMRLEDKTRHTQKEVSVGLVTIGTMDKVGYFGSATEADAKALGQVLLSAGFFSDKGSVALVSKDGSTVVSLVVADEVWDKPDSVAALENIVRGNASAIGGLPITFRLLNSPDLETKLEVSLH